MLKFINRSLNIAVPYFDGHVVACARQDIGMIWREFYFPHSQLMAHQSQERLVNVSSQIKHLDQIVGPRSRYKILILVEVDGEDVVGVGVYSFFVFASSEVPDAAHLVSGAATEDTIVGRMPDCRISSIIVHKRPLWVHLLRHRHRRRLLQHLHVPEFDTPIVGRTQNFYFVDVIPFA